MPVGKARKDQNRTVTRTTQRLALAAVLTIFGSQGLHTAVANGDTRTISLHHTHRGDDITVTFKRNGRYDDDGLKKLNHFLRDWRTDDATTMDPQLFDAVWEVQREFGSTRRSTSFPPTARRAPTRCCASARTASPATPCTCRARRWTSLSLGCRSTECAKRA